MPEKSQGAQAVEAMHQVQSGMSRLKYLARQGDEAARMVVGTGFEVVTGELHELGQAIDRADGRGQAPGK